MLTTRFVTGAPNWIRRRATDIDGATSFYGGLFGWRFRSAGPEAGGYGFFELDGRIVAGGMQTTPEQGPPSWTVYFQTPDADAAAKASEQARGGVLMRPMDVLDQGTMAILADRAGVPFGVWQPGRLGGLTVAGETGAPVLGRAVHGGHRGRRRVLPGGAGAGDLGRLLPGSTYTCVNRRARARRACSAASFRSPTTLWRRTATGCRTSRSTTRTPRSPDPGARRHGADARDGHRGRRTPRPSGRPVRRPVRGTQADAAGGVGLRGGSGRGLGRRPAGGGERGRGGPPRGGAGRGGGRCRAGRREEPGGQRAWSGGGVPASVSGSRRACPGAPPPGRGSCSVSRGRASDQGRRQDDAGRLVRLGLPRPPRSSPPRRRGPARAAAGGPSAGPSPRCPGGPWSAAGRSARRRAACRRSRPRQRPPAPAARPRAAPAGRPPR